jgi:hypothetical protein
MALPKRIVKETERLMAEPYVHGSYIFAANIMGLIVPGTVYLVSAQYPTKIT